MSETPTAMGIFSLRRCILLENRKINSSHIKKCIVMTWNWYASWLLHISELEWNISYFEGNNWYEIVIGDSKFLPFKPSPTKNYIIRVSKLEWKDYLQWHPQWVVFCWSFQPLSFRMDADEPYQQSKSFFPPVLEWRQASTVLYKQHLKNTEWQFYHHCRLLKWNFIIFFF